MWLLRKGFGHITRAGAASLDYHCVPGTRKHLAHSRSSIRSGGRRQAPVGTLQIKVSHLSSSSRLIFFLNQRGIVARQRKKRKRRLNILLVMKFHFQTHRKAAWMWMSNAPLGVLFLRLGTSNSLKKWGEEKRWFSKGKKKSSLFKPVVVHLQVSKPPSYSTRPSGEPERRM